MAQILLATVRQMLDCQIHSAATEEEPFSLCSFCTNSHAGVRWTVHESNADNYPFGIHNFDIEFSCNNYENTVRIL